MYDRQHQRGRVPYTRRSIARQVAVARAVVALMAASSASAGSTAHAQVTAGGARPPVGRSVVATSYGIVATSQPLASMAGVQMLERGGNAIDAAIAANATIGLMEPMMNGMGGDLFAIVYEAKTGKLIYRRRLGTGGFFYASPLAANGNLYASSYNGVVVVFKAGDQLKVLARNDLGERIVATPALVDGRIYVRTEGHLYAFGDTR